MSYQIQFDNFTFSDASIVSGSIAISTVVDLPGDELAYDTFTAVVDYEDGAEIIWSPRDYDGLLSEDGYFFGVGTITGDITAVPYGTALTFMHGSVTNIYYIKNIVRTGQTQYKINAMSAIGLLEGQTFFGNVYTRASMATVLSEIINGAFTYTIATDVASQDVSGWVPICSRRDALHQLMFAMGMSITKDSNGGAVFVFLRGDNPKAVPDSRIYIGGTVDYNAPVTAVEVVEHDFFIQNADPTETLFDNTDDDPADGTMLQFDKPYHDLSATGLTIDESGVNYAVVSGNGTLTGKPYTHKERTIIRLSNDPAGANKTASSAECYLVNPQNSENVSKRLLSYYSSRRTIKADLVVSDEQSGDIIAFTDAFGDAATGILSQMDMVGSAIVKANCRIITDYRPVFFGNFYSSRSLVTASGTWTVPAGVYHIRVVLIPGGNGGDGGKAGTSVATSQTIHVTRFIDEYTYHCGWDASSNYKVPGGAGGAGGATGKVLVEDFDVVPGETITLVIGQGGAAGAANGGTGGSGTPTTASSTSLGSLSSANGDFVEQYVDPITGDIYCQHGEEGTAGGYGGRYNADGGSVGNDAGGSKGTLASGYDWGAGGGGGSGAAVGHAGSDGGNGSRQAPSGGVGRYTIVGGDAADGADADAPTGTAGYGCGGRGGNGGGAASLPGYASFSSPNNYDYPSQYPYVLQAGAGAAGGEGSVGLPGGNGLAIFYYNA